jgi:hypothetical protein
MRAPHLASFRGHISRPVGSVESTDSWSMLIWGGIGLPSISISNSPHCKSESSFSVNDGSPISSRNSGEALPVSPVLYASGLEPTRLSQRTSAARGQRRRLVRQGTVEPLRFRTEPNPYRLRELFEKRSQFVKIDRDFSSFSPSYTDCPARLKKNSNPRHFGRV